MSSRMLSALACALLVLVACKREAAATQSAASPTVQAEAAAPATAAAATTVEVPSLKVNAVDGTQYELAARRGKWVVVNFWATWCAPCIKEMPELSALDQKREDLEVVGLAYEEIDVPAMQEFLKSRPVVYPIAILDVYSPPTDFATPRGLPMTYLIAPDGKVAKQFLGPVTAEQIETAIAAASGSKTDT